MTVIDTPYEDLLKEVLENGSYKEDRTGNWYLFYFWRAVAL